VWVEAVLSKEDLIALMARVVPLTIRVGSDAAGAHSIELATATDLVLVADQGLRMTTRARVHWPILGIAVPIDIDPLRVMIEPRVASTPRGDTLSFSIEIEHADVAGLPAFVDRAIIDKINGELGARNAELAWAFGAMLSHRFEIPKLLDPIDSLALNVSCGKVRVTEEAIVLAIAFHADVSRRDDNVDTASGSHESTSLEAHRGPDPARPIVRRTPSLHRAALVGGATLAAIGTYVAVRGTGRLGARWLRRAFF
jgi:hypothetical protein